MCDISATRKSLSVIFVKLIWTLIGINAQVNTPQFYPNPAYNPKLNLNGYETPQGNPKYGGAGVLYQVDDNENPQGYAPPNFVYGEPRRTQGFEVVGNIPVNDPQSIPQNPGQNPGQISPNPGQVTLNSGQVPFDADFNKRNRFNGDIRRLLQGLDAQASQQCTSNVAAQWNFETNINEATQAEAVSIPVTYVFTAQTTFLIGFLDFLQVLVLMFHDVLISKISLLGES